MNPMIVAGEGSTTVLPAEVITAITEGCKKVATGAQEGITAVLPLGLGVFALIFQNCNQFLQISCSLIFQVNEGSMYRISPVHS